MISYLKQSTSVTVLLGPIVDSVDATPETGQTIAQSDVQLWKQGGAGLGAKNEATSCTHRTAGLYTCPLDTTDTGTLGVLTVSVFKTGTMSWRGDYLVVPANVYDSIVAGSANLAVDAVKLNSVAASAANLERSASVITTGTSYSSGGTTTYFETASITEATADHYKGRVVIFTGGALLGQATSVSAYALVSGRGAFTVAALTEAVPNGSTFVIV